MLGRGSVSGYGGEGGGAILAGGWGSAVLRCMTGPSGKCEILSQPPPTPL